jgi:hypothetical protein
MSSLSVARAAIELSPRAASIRLSTFQLKKLFLAHISNIVLKSTNYAVHK